MHRILFLLLLVPLACAPRRQRFEPVQDSQASSTHGLAAAVYALSGTGLGEGSVWVYSQDVRSTELESMAPSRTSSTTVRLEPVWHPGYVHVGFLVKNAGAQSIPLRFKEAELTVRLAGAGAYPIGPPAPTDLPSEAPPGEARIDLFFLLPRDFAVDKITAYEIRWSLGSSSAPYSQTTRFARDTAGRAIGFAPYDPYLGFRMDRIDPTWPYPTPPRPDPDTAP